MFKTLEDLVKTIRDRKNSNLEESYTNQLLNNKKISVEKVEEEFQLGVGSLFGNKDRSEKQDCTSECALASQPLLPRFQ